LESWNTGKGVWGCCIFGSIAIIILTIKFKNGQHPLKKFYAIIPLSPWTDQLINMENFYNKFISLNFLSVY